VKHTASSKRHWYSQEAYVTFDEVVAVAYYPASTLVSFSQEGASCDDPSLDTQQLASRVLTGLQGGCPRLLIAFQVYATHPDRTSEI
jgi:hypothetical protein